MQMVLTLPALERLIGGDTEIELILRKQIAREFAKQHLDFLVDEEVATRVARAEATVIEAAAKEEVDIDKLLTSPHWPSLSTRLRSIIRTEVEKLTQECVDAALRKVIEYQRRYWDKEITTAVNKALEANIKQQIADGVQAKLQAALNA